MPDEDSHIPPRWEKLDKVPDVPGELADESLTPSMELGINLNIGETSVGFSIDDEPPEPNQ